MKKLTIKKLILSLPLSLLLISNSPAPIPYVNYIDPYEDITLLNIEEYEPDDNNPYDTISYNHYYFTIQNNDDYIIDDGDVYYGYFNIETFDGELFTYYVSDYRSFVGPYETRKVPVAGVDPITLDEVKSIYTRGYHYYLIEDAQFYIFDCEYLYDTNSTKMTIEPASQRRHNYRYYTLKYDIDGQTYYKTERTVNGEDTKFEIETILNQEVIDSMELTIHYVVYTSSYSGVKPLSIGLMLLIIILLVNVAAFIIVGIVFLIVRLSTHKKNNKKKKKEGVIVETTEKEDQ